MGGGSKAVPDRWLEYTAVGKPIPRTRIICFKVPLKMEICRSLPRVKWFTPAMVIDSIPALVGVIDVTNTPRYYDRQEFLRQSIKHEKILCPGHVVPPNNVVSRFQTVMKDFLSNADIEDKYVGVHCTHGVNRTGYLVCRYLIECRGFQPEEAIRLFGESRGHPIERENYLNDLKALVPKHVEQALTQPRTTLGYPVSDTTRIERCLRSEGPRPSGISTRPPDQYTSVPNKRENWSRNGHYPTRSGRMMQSSDLYLQDRCMSSPTENWRHNGYYPPTRSGINRQSSDRYVQEPYTSSNSDNWRHVGHYGHSSQMNRPYDSRYVNFHQHSSPYDPNRRHQSSDDHPSSSQRPYRRHNQ